MMTLATPTDFSKVPDPTGEWAPLGTASQRFTSATLYGYKANNTNNTGNIRIRSASTDEASYTVITPGGILEITPNNDGIMFNMAQFEIWSETAADGVYVTYAAV